jgi:hypothetical protein
MKTLKQQMEEAVARFRRDFGTHKELREQIQKDLRTQDQTELWQIEDAIADLEAKFNPYRNEI